MHVCVTTMVKLRCIKVAIGATDTMPVCVEPRMRPLPGGRIIRLWKVNMEGGRRLEETGKREKLDVRNGASRRIFHVTVDREFIFNVPNCFFFSLLKKTYWNTSKFDEANDSYVITTFFLM